MIDLRKRSWWNYIHSDIRELLYESLILIEKVRKWDEKFNDYAFVVFPAAKAYEGFLKFLFFKMNFISQEKYFSKGFRIGKALNPSLEKFLREQEGVYDKIVDHCGGEILAAELWETWKSCRNVLFHWFPEEKNMIDFSEAEDRVNRVINTMDLAFRECKINYRH